MRRPVKVAVPDLIALPKVQLHCHLEGTTRASTFRDLASRAGIDVGPEPYAFTDFGGFLYVFIRVLKSLDRPADYARIAREWAEDAREQGVLHAELFVSPSGWQRLHPELPLRETMEAVREALDAAEAAGGPSAELIVDLTRNFGPDAGLVSVDFAASCRDLGVIGIGLGGDEANFPTADFVRPFQHAAALGLHRHVHAGEAAGPESVRDAVELLGAERIGHGVRAADDPGVVALLARRRVPIEVCPTSNRLTGAVRPGALHPLAAFDAAGIPVVIDADDPALFGTTLVEEYRAAAALAGDDAPERFARNAVEASFAAPERKMRLRAAFGKPTGPGRRS